MVNTTTTTSVNLVSSLTIDKPQIEGSTWQCIPLVVGLLPRYRGLGAHTAELGAHTAKSIETGTPVRGALDKMIARQSILLKAAQKTQFTLDSHHIAQHDPNYTEYPIISYVLFTAPTGTSDKLELKHRGPYQVVNKLDSIYTIQDLVDGKLITTHIKSLREFLFDPARINPLDIFRSVWCSPFVSSFAS